MISKRIRWLQAGIEHAEYPWPLRYPKFALLAILAAWNLPYYGNRLTGMVAMPTTALPRRASDTRVYVQSMHRQGVWVSDFGVAWFLVDHVSVLFLVLSLQFGEWFSGIVIWRRNGCSRIGRRGS